MSSTGLDNIESKTSSIDLNGDVVTPWSVESSSSTGVDYDKLICMFYISNLWHYQKPIFP